MKFKSSRRARWATLMEGTPQLRRSRRIPKVIRSRFGADSTPVTCEGYATVGSMPPPVLDGGPDRDFKMKCTYCNSQTKAERLAPGWHRDTAGNPLCSKCWNSRHILRAVTIPIAGPIDGTWPELRESLKKVWKAATRLSNWIVRERAKADVVRTADMAKLPKPPQTCLYRGARAVATEIDSGSVSAILHAVEKKWRARRFNVVWLGKESLPNYRYPTPCPIRSSDWKCGKDGEVIYVNVRLAGRRWKLRLRGGHQFRRQIGAVHQLLAGEAIGAEMALYERRSNDNDHRPQSAGRDSGGQKCASRLMCKMVMWLPREDAVKNKTGTLVVRTDAESLLLALDIKGQKLWVENCDQVRRWTAEHSRRLNRWSDDAKAEQRPIAKYQSRRESATLKYRHRLDSLCHEISAHLANFAARRRYATVQYDDSLQSYCVRFPWAQLRKHMRVKLGEREIQFEWSGATKNAGASRSKAGDASEAA
jgi:hypothetical protein